MIDLKPLKNPTTAASPFSSASSYPSRFETNAQIDTEISNTRAADSIVSVSILLGSMPRVEVRRKNGIAGTTSLTRAGLLVRLVSIEKMIAIQRLVRPLLL